MGLQRGISYFHLIPTCPLGYQKPIFRGFKVCVWHFIFSNQTPGMGLEWTNLGLQTNRAEFYRGQVWVEFFLSSRAKLDKLIDLSFPFELEFVKDRVGFEFLTKRFESSRIESIPSLSKKILLFSNFNNWLCLFSTQFKN